MSIPIYAEVFAIIKLFKIIEDIEVALKTKIAYVLGRSNLNSYGYLNFSNWCNKEEYYKHYKKFLKYTEKGDRFWLNGWSL